MVLVIDELRVISFDRFHVKMPSSVMYDDQVRIHLSYVRHLLKKRAILHHENKFCMPEIGYFPATLPPV